MERMAAPLSEVVPLLLASHGNKARGGAAASVPLGDVAAAMLDCLRALHERGLLFVDVKPENFMLSGAATPAAKSGSGRKKKASSSSSTDLGKRVRLIDFGLVEPWNDVVQGGRREDEGGALVGTPAYASLHVSSGHTAALRDDLEALGYVVAELALTMLSSSGKKGGASGGKRKKKDDDDGVLPWSHAKSEDELYNIKRDEMDEGKRSESKLFAGLKAAGADAVMGDYFAAVRGLKYSETPDYDSLRSCLKELAVTVDGKGVSAGARAASGAAPKKKSAAKSPARRRSARRKQEDSDSEDDDVVVVDENVENGTARGKRPNVSVGMARAARPTRNARKAKKETREMGTQTTPEVIDLNSSDDDDDADTMDWEAVASDENAAPDDGGGARGRGVLKLVVVEGPHQGQEISFGGDLPDTVLVGRDPASRAAAKDAARFALPADGSASAVHAKFVVGSKTKVRSVRVHDMSSANGTYVQGSGLPKGKSRQAFANDKIRVGESLLQIRKA